MDYPFFGFPWTCLSPRSCVKAEGDLDGLYAAMGLGYFARCAMERAQWGAGQLSRTYEQQGTMATMVDGGWNVSIVSTNQFVWGFDKCLWNGCLVPKSRSRGVWACSLVLASFSRVISMWRCITWQGSKRKYGLGEISVNTWIVASCLCFMNDVSVYIPYKMVS